MVYGIGDHAVLRPLDDLDLADLRLDVARPESAVDDADPAFLGLHDGHRRARDRVHVGGDDRALEGDRRERRHDRSMAEGSRRARTLCCGVRRKSSNVQPRTVARTARPTLSAIMTGTLERHDMDLKW